MEHLELDRKLQEIVSRSEIFTQQSESFIDELKEYPALYFIAYWGDRGGSLIIFHDPNHTISWNIATMAKNGDPIAKKMCQALNLLSPDHCAWALQNEALLKI